MKAIIIVLIVLVGLSSASPDRLSVDGIPARGFSPDKFMTTDFQKMEKRMIHDLSIFLMKISPAAPAPAPQVSAQATEIGAVSPTLIGQEGAVRENATDAAVPATLISEEAGLDSSIALNISALPPLNYSLLGNDTPSNVTETNVTSINVTEENITVNNLTSNNLTDINLTYNNVSTDNFIPNHAFPNNSSFSNNSSQNLTLGSVDPSSLPSATLAIEQGSEKPRPESFWSMEANKGSGQEGVKSQTYLSGSFEVEKSVAFHES
jgi:hypothetical protein